MARRRQFDLYDLGDFIQELDLIGRRMRIISLVVVVCTVANVAQAFVWLLPFRLTFTASSISLALTLSVVGCSIYFESLRKQGEAIYSELSDEFHRTRNSTTESEFSNLRYRVTLRKFATAMDLPLIPGKFGPIGYIVVNIGILAYVFQAFARRYF
jgi:hypothetical protein